MAGEEVRHLNFLSRLCGGEDIVKTEQPRQAFLSRLCGGEVIADIQKRSTDFLSRLCGGEDVIRGLLTEAEFSKPPMWR